MLEYSFAASGRSESAPRGHIVRLARGELREDGVAHRPVRQARGRPRRGGLVCHLPHFQWQELALWTRARLGDRKLQSLRVAY